MHLPEHWGYIEFAESPQIDQPWVHKTDAQMEQITYAVFRKIAYGDYKYLRDQTPGEIIPIKLKDSDGRKLKISLLNSYTGFDLELEDQDNGAIYTIDERGYINRPSGQ